jgi:hypothetical protein
VAERKRVTDSPFVFRLHLNGRLSGYNVVMRELPLRQAAQLAEMDAGDPKNVRLVADLLDEFVVRHDLPGIGALSEVGTATAQKIVEAWLSGSEEQAVPPAGGGA